MKKMISITNVYLVLLLWWVVDLSFLSFHIVDLVDLEYAFWYSLVRISTHLNWLRVLNGLRVLNWLRVLLH